MLYGGMGRFEWVNLFENELLTRSLMLFVILKILWSFECHHSRMQLRQKYEIHIYLDRCPWIFKTLPEVCIHICPAHMLPWWVGQISESDGWLGSNVPPAPTCQSGPCTWHYHMGTGGHFSTVRKWKECNVKLKMKCESNYIARIVLLHWIYYW